MAEKRQCPDCERMVMVNKDGRLRKHPWCTPATVPIEVNMRDIVKAKTSWFCVACGKAGRKGARVVSLGGFYQHPGCTPMILEEPTPTEDDEVERMISVAISGILPAEECSENDCSCPADWISDDAHLEGCPEIDDGTSSIGSYAADDQSQADPAPAEHRPGQPPAPAEISYWQTQAREAAARHLELEQHPASSAPVMFSTPGEPGPTLTPEDEFMFDTPSSVPQALNVSGQPPAERDSMGRYLVKDPAIGDYRRFKNGNRIGITRTTTFVKAASNNAAISDWKCRNVLIGASLRPDLVRKAHGLTHERDKAELMSLCTKLEEVAGAKVAADEGTFLHEFTELMDAGLKTWGDAPKAYQESLKLYAETLAAAGLEPVSGLIERTVFISEFGGVCGTFDRVYYHRPSDTYVVGDVKTGKTLKYGMNEIEAQIWTYAHGINQNGIYDWNTDTWGVAGECAPTFGDPITVSETVGIIIHMPVQGPDQGTVRIRHADLISGARHAELCHANRDQPKSKVRDWAPPLPALPPGTQFTWDDRPLIPEPAVDDGIVDAVIVEDEPTGGIDFSKIDPTPWEVLFSQVRDAAEARALWDRAAAAESVSVQDLAGYVEIARQALRVRG